MSGNADDPKLKETEDLLAGFDRPGRTPRTPAVQQDFVDYFKKDARERNSAPPDPGARARTTFVIERPSRRLPAWLGWTAAFVVMPLAGGFAAYFALRTGEAPAPASSSSSSPSSSAPAASSAPMPNATTILPAAALSTVDPKPVPPPTPSVVRSAAPTRGGAAPPPSASSSGDPRVDFIRNL
jgi:hypothetical protein